MRSYRWFWIPTLIISVAAIICCFVPLLHLLGYEFAFVITLIAAPTSVIIGYSANRNSKLGLVALVRASIAAVIHLLPALAIITFNALRVKNCNLLDGLGFFILLPILSAIYASILGTIVTASFKSHPRLCLISILTILLLPLTLSLYKLYSQPPILVFDHLWGYFAGSLYDEVITIDTRLLLFRTGTFLRIAALILLVWLWQRRAGIFSWLISITVALVVIIGFETSLGPRFGFNVTREDIKTQLPQVVERPGLVIHLPRELDTKQRYAIADDHAFRLWQLKNILGLKSLPTIHSYIYPNAQTKAILMGGRNTMIAKPWLFEIHIHGTQTPHPVVAHELAHVVAASFAPAPLRVSSRFGFLINVGLIEGLAVAVTPPINEFSINTWSKALRELGLAPDMHEIFSPMGFWAAAPNRAYTVAGSFVYFLLHKYGPSRLRNVYAHGDFKEAYGIDLDALITQWELYIDTWPLTVNERALAQEHFSSASVFTRICAHEIAKLKSLAATAKPSQAVELHRQIAKLLNHNPNTLFDLALALERNENYIEFTELAEQLLKNKKITTIQRSRLLEALGNNSWRGKQYESAQQQFNKVQKLPLSIASHRLQWVRLWALKLPKVDNDFMRLFLSQKLPAAAAMAGLMKMHHEMPNDKTLPYLIGRQLVIVNAYEQALPYFIAAKEHPYKLIEAERSRLAALSADKSGKLAIAINNYIMYIKNAPCSGENFRALDEIVRLSWQINEERGD
ncbi:MAG: hypothetical protein JW841_14265 [Deltaproteobacteria bacterium]|nr:hypothetical protein [Deltaproteobacteria bacterium]